MALVSALAHVAVIGTLLLLPGGWLASSQPDARVIMNVSLSGGNDGPNNGGLNSISQRAVQAETPPEPPKRPEPVRAPAARTPEMTEPLPARTPPRPAPVKAATPPPAVRQAPDQARGRTPTKGSETREGNALAETGARGQGFGLSTSGGTGSGSSLDIVGDFCCPEYLGIMTERIRTNWNPVAEVAGVVVVKYTIQRDGTIVDSVLERSSGYSALDLNALRAVLGTRQLPPLPSAFPNPSLTVHLNFQYRR
jgi:TonB family protein